MNMSHDEFFEMLGVIKDNYRGGEDFAEVIYAMMNMLDMADEFDVYGSECWNHWIGWED